MSDLINRQAAIDALCKRCDLAQDDDEPCTEKCNDIKILEKMPPAQPKEAFEIGKPYPLKGYELRLFKDAYGDDWVLIKEFDRD